MVRNTLITVIMTSLLTYFAHAYPEGPPLSACRDMQPRTQMGELEMEGHTTRPQNEFPTQGRPAVPPYHILIHPMPIHYEPGGTYNVYVVSDQTHGSNVYLGLLLQARKVICYGNGTIDVEDDTIGTFSLPNPQTTVLQTMDCNEIENSAVSHKSRQYKINETMTWHAPDHYAGHIAFWATIVQEDVVYWMGAHSLVMLDPNERLPVACRGCKTNQQYIALIVFLLFAQKLFQSIIHR